MNTVGVRLSTVSNSWMVKNSRIDELLAIQIASEYQYENCPVRNNTMWILDYLVQYLDEPGF